jgi:hemoglobin/transferrin/lactoferrin receptor protein
VLCPLLSVAQTELPDTVQTNSMDEVIISANKAEETRKTISQQVQLMTAKQIRQAQAQTTADLLSNTAGIFVQRSQMGGGSPVLRGFEASRIVLVVDGVRLNNLIYRAGHLQNILSLDNNSLERVEVLFGPSSTMYGSRRSLRREMKKCT